MLAISDGASGLIHLGAAAPSGTAGFEHVVEGGGIQTRVTRQDPRRQQLAVVGAFSLGSVESFPAVAASRTGRHGFAFGTGAPHEVGDLDEVLRHALADPSPLVAVDEDEEG